MSKIRVALGEAAYDILVEKRVLADAGEHIKPHLKNARVIIVSDETVAKLYLHRLTSTLEEAGIAYRPIILPAGEQTKSYAVFQHLLESILEQKPDRATMLIALGGGVIGDVTGFAASVILRGLNFIQIPTTLLAQVDSAVGGKTAINSAHGKNLIGSFHQPKLVLADVSVLSTLPKRELLAGYAETVKYGLINDADFFTWLEKNAAAMLQHDTELLTYAITHACQAKASIVAQDEKESGVRALLNFGHTFAHALEAETGFSDQLLHGEAVAIGMIMALQLSVKMGLCGQAELARVKAHFEAVGLPASPLSIQKGWNIEALMAHFAADKKAKSGTLTFILTRGIGQAFVAQNVDVSAVRALLAETLAIA